MKSKAQCKICRREGKKVFLKGDRCLSQKCALIRRKYPPGMHGPKGAPRLSDYGRQLREKQHLKRFYCLSEKQFSNYFVKAKKIIGNTEEKFLTLLEKRLDNVVYRAGFAVSRKKARQLVSHGNIIVNNRKIDIPSYQVKIGDSIKPKNKKSIIEQIKEHLNQDKNQEMIPTWLSLDKNKMEIKVLKDPAVDDLPQEFEMELIVGFYSR